MKRALLAADPGLWHAEQALETVAAVLLALGVLRRFGQPIALFGALAAGFVLQCVAGRTRRAELAGMAMVGVACVVAAVLGSLLGHVPIVGAALPIAGAFLALRARSFAPSPQFTLFPFLFLAISAALAGGARVVAVALAITAGSAVALAVHALAPRVSASRAYQHVLRAFCAEAAALVRILGAVARGADPEAQRRRLDHGLRTLERRADLGRSVAGATGDGSTPLEALVRDQHEVVHAIVTLRRTVVSSAAHGERALAALIDRLADAMSAIAGETAVDSSPISGAVRDVEAAALAPPCRPPTQLGALAVAAAVARRLDVVCARFASARAKLDEAG